MELILSIVIPISSTIFLYPLICHNKYLRQKSWLIKICLTFAFSLSLLIILLSLISIILPRGFSLLSKVIFTLTLILTVYSLIKIFSEYKLGKLIKFFQNKSLNLLSALITVYFIVYLFIFFLRPVTGADVIDNYLPLARTMIQEDRAPIRNFYDNSPFIIPPIGGPALFAYYYAISGNLQSEVFKFMNIPLFIGIVIISYLIYIEHLPKKYSLLAILIFMSIPLVEDLVFTAGLYPDIAFNFLILCCLWMITNFLKNSQQQNITILFIICGLSLAATMLLKYQAVFFWVIGAFLLGMIYLSQRWKYIALLILYLPFFLSFLIGDENIYNSNPYIMTTAIILVGIIGIFFIRNYTQSIKVSFSWHTLVMVILTLLGLSFIVRTYLIFGGLIDTEQHHLWISKIHRQISSMVKYNQDNYFKISTIFFDPSLSIFYLLAKITGLWKVLYKKSYLPVFLILTIYYLWWVVLLGGESIRWFFPIVPYLVIIIILGLMTLVPDFHKMKKIVFWGSFFNLFSSKFIFWNLAVMLFGSQTLRSSTDFVKTTGINNLLPKITTLNHFSIPNIFINKLYKLLFILSSRTSLEFSDVTQIMIYGIIIFLFSLMMVKWLKKAKKELLILIFILLSYGLTFMTVSRGNILNFPENEKKYLFDYWGQDISLIPYLKNHADKDDIVIAFSDPSGLSYYTNLRVYSIEYGFGLSLFYPIFYEDNLDKIRQYYLQHRIRYIAIRNYGTSPEKYKNLKKLSRIFDIIDYSYYSKAILIPDEQSYWYLYEII